ncbi:MAG: nitrous oxide reductase accessory protein NosL [Limnochordaceae bacterium]|nr:nitrous oxide reductase accessory protein NosL [Limnochordaceae bacterium]
MRGRGKLTVILAGIVLAAGAVAVGLATRSQGPPPPAQVLYGVDDCVECGMVLTDPRSAAQMITTDRVVKFCDVGCLVVYQLRHHPDWKGVRAAYVPDWHTQQWLDARTAWWVTTHHKTPMLYGLVTLRDRGEAEAMAREHGGRVMTYDEVAAMDLLREEARR